MKEIKRIYFENMEDLNIWLQDNENLIKIINICASGTGIGDIMNIIYTDKECQDKPKQKCCGKYIENEDRNCGEWYNFKNIKDEINFFNKEDFKSGGIYLCPKCQEEEKGEKNE